MATAPTRCSRSQWGERSNTLSAGFDYNFISFQHTNNSPFGGSSVTDLGNTRPGDFINVAGTVPKFRTHTNQVAAFVEDRLSLSSALSVIGGLRADRYDVDRRISSPTPRLNAPTRRPDGAAARSTRFDLLPPMASTRRRPKRSAMSSATTLPTCCSIRRRLAKWRAGSNSRSGASVENGPWRATTSRRRSCWRRSQAVRAWFNRSARNHHAASNSPPP